MTASTREAVATFLDNVFLPKLAPEMCESRILVVDDDPIVRSIALALLTRFGFTQVDEAAEGGGALALLEEHDYGLVISDLVMEPMDGVSLFRAMRADKRKVAIPFILLTASMRHDTVALARKAGIKHYVLKPFRIGAFHKKLLDVLTARAGIPDR
jgi:two-component system chemotaxis response regulator CheY